MFDKLVKHEFRATARIIPFVYLVTIFLALVHVITAKLNLGAVSKISLVLMVMMCFAQVAIAFVLVIWRYYKNLYSPEGYLTHTLPVHPSQLLWSKLLVGFVWTALSYLVGAVVFVGVMMSDFVKSADQLAEISKIYHAFLAQTGLDKYEAAIWIFVIAMMLLSIVLLLTEAYFAITVGNLSKLHSLGIGGPILVYFAEYISLQIVGTVAIMFVPLGISITTSGDKLLGFKLVTQNMFSQISTNFNAAGASGAGSDSGIIGIAYYILIPFIMVGLLLWIARIITRHTSIK